jgi:hypothetical protein
MMFRIGTEAVALSRAQRLGALYRIIPREKVKRIVRATGHSKAFCGRLPAAFMVYFLLAMGLFCTDCYQQVFRWLRPFKKQTVPGRSTLCEARQRVGIRPLALLAKCTVKLLATETSGAFYHGMRLMALDGFVMDIPDMPANDRVFGRPAGGRTPGAFPQVRILALCEAATHVMWRWLIKPIRISEQAMASRLLNDLQAGMLLLWDRNFLGYHRVGQVIARSCHLLARIKKDQVTHIIRRLDDGSYLAKMYQRSFDRQHDRNGIWVRIIEYTLNDPNRTGHQQKHRLLTTLLDEKVHPATTLIELYHVRWEEELAIDEIKSHQMQRPVLRSQTPAGVVQELYAIFLDHYVVRVLMFEAALAAQVPPLRISFVAALKILRCRIPECPRRRSARRAWWRKLVAEVAEEVLPLRRNLINPRVIKRKMSCWRKKGPQDRPGPQPRTSFAEAISMIH